MKTFFITIFVLALTSPAFADVKRAKRLYSQRNYKQAAVEYYKVYSRTKKTADKRKAEWGLAQTLQKVGLLYSSSKYYSTIVGRGKKREIHISARH